MDCVCKLGWLLSWLLASCKPGLSLLCPLPFLISQYRGAIHDVVVDMAYWSTGWAEEQEVLFFSQAHLRLTSPEHGATYNEFDLIPIKVVPTMHHRARPLNQSSLLYWLFSRNIVYNESCLVPCLQVDVSLEPSSDRGLDRKEDRLWFQVEVDRAAVEPLVSHKLHEHLFTLCASSSVSNLFCCRS